MASEALDTSDDLWDDVHSCLLEIEWYAIRKKNLASDPHSLVHKTWGDMLISDIADLHSALVKVQQGYARTSIPVKP